MCKENAWDGINPCNPNYKCKKFDKVVATWQTVRHYETRSYDTIHPIFINDCDCNKKCFECEDCGKGCKCQLKDDSCDSSDKGDCECQCNCDCENTKGQKEYKCQPKCGQGGAFNNCGCNKNYRRNCCGFNPFCCFFR